MKHQTSISTACIRHVAQQVVGSTVHTKLSQHTQVTVYIEWGLIKLEQGKKYGAKKIAWIRIL